MTVGAAGAGVGSGAVVVDCWEGGAAFRSAASAASNAFFQVLKSRGTGYDPALIS